ncbi:MAG: DUF5615 family PIN-like protein [Aridibacter sp.]
MLRLFIDHDFNYKILRALTQRIPDLDFVTTLQLGKEDETDENHLNWATKENRVILTHDVNTFTNAAYNKLKNGERISGLIVVPQTLQLGIAIDELEIIITCCKENELKNRIEFLPLGLNHSPYAN